MEQITEMTALVATIDPAAYGTGAQVTDEIDMALWRRVAFYVVGGTLGTAATLDFTVKGGATSNAGSHTTVVTGKSITQFVKASNDNDQAIVEVSAAECAAQGLRYIEGVLTVGEAASGVCVAAIGVPARTGPAYEHDLASVVEVVS